jgi:hypothetical protein
LSFLQDSGYFFKVNIVQKYLDFISGFLIFGKIYLHTPQADNNKKLPFGGSVYSVNNF